MNRTTPLSARPVASLTVMDAVPSSSLSLSPALAGGDSMGEAMPFGERRERLEEWVVVLLLEDEEEYGC
jgi:hypothetical protein